jgi:PAS domain S-box-containing protein
MRPSGAHNHLTRPGGRRCTLLEEEETTRVHEGGSRPHQNDGDAPQVPRPAPGDRAMDARTRRDLIAAMIALFLTEIAIMVIMKVPPPMPPVVAALADAGLLLVLIFPALYLSVFKPLLKQVEARRKTQAALEASHADLDRRVTERTEELAAANGALRRERNFVDAVVDTAGALVVVLDRSGVIVRFNTMCEAASGLSSTQVMGQVYFELLVPDEERREATETSRSVCAGDYPSEAQNHWLTRGGGRRFISWWNTALCDSDGEVEFARSGKGGVDA